MPSELCDIISLGPDVHRLAIRRFRFLREDLRSCNAAGGWPICTKPWAASASMSTGLNVAGAAGGTAEGAWTTDLCWSSACFLAAALVVGLLRLLLATLPAATEGNVQGCSIFSPAATAESTEGAAEPSTSDLRYAAK